VFFEPLHVVICFMAQFVHPINEGTLLICIIERISSQYGRRKYFFCKGRTGEAGCEILTFFMNQGRTGRFSLSFLIGICKRSQWNSNDVLLGETLHCLEKVYLQICFGARGLLFACEKLMPASAHYLSHMGAFIR